jgi:hypothetical protein
MDYAIKRQWIRVDVRTNAKPSVSVRDGLQAGGLFFLFFLLLFLLGLYDVILRGINIDGNLLEYIAALIGLVGGAIGLLLVTWGFVKLVSRARVERRERSDRNDP